MSLDSLLTYHLRQINGGSYSLKISNHYLTFKLTELAPPGNSELKNFPFNLSGKFVVVI